MKLPRIVAFVAAFAVPAALATPIVPTCTTGVPASIADTAGGRLDLFPMYTAPSSSPLTRVFGVRDGAGFYLKNVQVELTLPASLPSARFGRTDGIDFVYAAEPRRAIVTTGPDCYAFTPEFAAETASGHFSLELAVVSSPTVHASQPVIVVEDAVPKIHVPSTPLGLAVPPGFELRPQADVSWSNGTQGGRLGGAMVRFSAPETGASAVFPNGLHTIEIPSNPAGYASVKAVANEIPGTFDVTVTMGSTSFVAWRYAIAGGGEVTVDAPQSMRYGAPESLAATVQFPWAACGVSPRPSEFLGPVTYSADGFAFGGTATAPALAANCTSTYSLVSSLSLAELPVGTHRLAARYGGAGGWIKAGQSPDRTISVAHDLEASAPDGSRYRLAAASPLYNAARGECAITARAGSLGQSGWPVQGPPHSDGVLALFSIDASNCTWTAAPGAATGAPLPALARRVSVEHEGIDYLPSVVAFAYGPTPENPADHWYELRTSRFNRNLHFEVVDGGAGDASLARNGAIHSVIALAVPRNASIPGTFQDLWWAGSSENGWGMSITQHRDVLFGELFIYDAQGNPRWLVMPSGQWDASGKTYTAAVYRPRGAPLSNYDASRFSIGPPVGTVRLTLMFRDELRLDYTIDGVSGTKEIYRIYYGPYDVGLMPRYDDLWWGGPSQNGWGLVVAQQYRSLFTLWYTYDNAGEATWFVAPSGAVLGPGLYLADVYRPTGSAWLGATYDASRYSATKVGTMQISFEDGWEQGSLSVNVSGVSKVVPITRVPF